MFSIGARTKFPSHSLTEMYRQGIGGRILEGREEGIQGREKRKGREGERGEDGGGGGGGKRDGEEERKGGREGWRGG